MAIAQNSPRHPEQSEGSRPPRPRTLRGVGKALARFFATLRMTIADGVSFAELRKETE